MLSIERRSNLLSRLYLSLLLGIAIYPTQLLGAEQAISSVPQTASAVPQTDTVLPQSQPAPQTEPAPQTVPPPLLPIPVTSTTDSYDAMESSRNYMAGKITRFASYLDNFFGGDRHYQESNDSVLQMDLTKVNGYNSDHKLNFAVRANLRLPITEGRLHLLIESDPEKNITPEPIPGTVAKNKAAGSNGVALALRYAKAEEGVWHFSSDAGVKFPIPAHVFARTRLSYAVPLSNTWRLTATGSAYWFDNTGIGEANQLNFERIYSSQVLFSASSTVTWRRDTLNYDMRQDFSVFHTLDDRTALLYQVSALGVSRPVYAATDYVALINYRYRMHKKWLFFEISPQLHFPQVRQYHFSPVLSMRLEVLFDDTR